MNSIRVGFAMCGSFCTFSQVIPQLEKLIESGAQVTPIMSESAYYTDTRFGKAEELIGTLLFLLSKDASSFVNGVVIPVDGGFSAYSGV